MALNARKTLFVAEFLIDRNATAAATRAGYSEKTAKSIGSRLLHEPEVAAAIQAGIDEMVARAKMTVDEVLRELAKLGRANMLDYMRVTPEGKGITDFSNLTRDQAAAIQELTVEEFVRGRGDGAERGVRTKFKLTDKRGALSDILRHESPEKLDVNHTGKIGINITISADDANL